MAYELSNGPYRNESLPENANISCAGCGKWEALTEIHADPQIGVHAFAFANHETKQAIMAFRGACFDPMKKSCRADACFLIKHHAYGSETTRIFGDEMQWGCPFMEKRKLSYHKQAWDRVNLLKTAYPGYNVLLVGHSLGGFLAAYVAAQMPGEVQAITFQPLTVGRELEEREGLSPEALDAKANGDILSLCDPYDCAFRSFAERDSRRGTVSCFYDEWDRSQVPASCYGMRDKARDMNLDADEWAALNDCITDSHEFYRYHGIAHFSRDNSSSQPLLPTCSSDLSVLSNKVADSMRYAQRQKIGPWSVAEI